MTILKIPVKVVDQLRRGSGDNVSIQMVDAIRRRGLLGETYCFPEFPVCLSIQLVSSDKDASTLLCCVEEDQVSWQSLVFCDFDYHTGLEILTFSGFVAISSKNLVLLLIHILVSPIPLDIVIGLLAHGDKEHKAERRQVSKQEPDPQERNQLGKSDQKEKEVEKELKFVEKHHRDETEDGIFLVVKLVRVETTRLRPAV
jgi:hypothetical protein